MVMHEKLSVINSVIREGEGEGTGETKGAWMPYVGDQLTTFKLSLSLSLPPLFK